MSEPEAIAAAIDQALLVAAAEWQPNDGPWEATATTYVMDALAAAGYTVTRSKYEPAVGGYVFAGNGRWMWTRGTPPNEPLYRKIEGSTDGADRD